MEKYLKALKIPYKDIDIYIKALTHSSYAHENNIESNERLEFLGDAVLEILSSEHFFHSTNWKEGQMTKKRAQSVREEALAIYGKSIEIEKHMLLGKGEIQKGANDAMIADAFEALLAAVYVDLGLKYARIFFNKVVKPHLKETLVIKDYKSTLQEYIQGGDKRNLSYHTISESGPSHNKSFVSNVKLDGNIVLGIGSGKTKKEAEQQAAKDALRKSGIND